MIYTDSQLKEKIVRMIESFENEVVEFKDCLLYTSPSPRDA